MSNRLFFLRAIIATVVAKSMIAPAAPETSEIIGIGVGSRVGGIVGVGVDVGVAIGVVWGCSNFNH